MECLGERALAIQPNFEGFQAFDKRKRGEIFSKSFAVNPPRRFFDLFEDTRGPPSINEVGQVKFLGSPRQSQVNFNDIRPEIRADEEVNPDVHGERFALKIEY